MVQAKEEKEQEEAKIFFGVLSALVGLASGIVVYRTAFVNNDTAKINRDTAKINYDTAIVKANVCQNEDNPRLVPEPDEQYNSHPLRGKPFVPPVVPPVVTETVSAVPPAKTSPTLVADKTPGPAKSQLAQPTTVVQVVPRFARRINRHIRRS